MSEKINIEIELSDEFLTDILCTIVESAAINYWGEVDDVRYTTVPGSSVGHDGKHRAVDLIDRYLSFHIRDDEDGRGFWFDTESVAKGIRVALSPGFQLNRETRGYIHGAATNDDAGDIDITAADVIVQAAVFGELIYG